MPASWLAHSLLCARNGLLVAALILTVTYSSTYCIRISQGNEECTLVRVVLNDYVSSVINIFILRAFPLIIITDIYRTFHDLEMRNFRAPQAMPPRCLHHNFCRKELADPLPDVNLHNHTKTQLLEVEGFSSMMKRIEVLCSFCCRL